MNKRDVVLKRLKPISVVIGIEIDYHDMDQNGREYLTLNGQNICTNYTSIIGIENEFWGYVHILKYERLHPFEKHSKNVIRRYWYDSNFKQPYVGDKL